MNFFLVSLVLVNLFIAMMSSTYDRVNQQSTLEWNLVRARIITNLDRELSNQSTLEWNLVRARIITNLDRELSNQ
ncbi:hypothetical protein T484DRAFT_1784880, partial [Baffinella frigidus]